MTGLVSQQNKKVCGLEPLLPPLGLAWDIRLHFFSQACQIIILENIFLNCFTVLILQFFQVVSWRFV